MNFVLPKALNARIENEARLAYPQECCGLIEGLCEGDRALASALHPARNLAVQRDRFEIDPKDHFAALKTARNRGRAIIGCYHSHPRGRAWPSGRDVEGAGEDGFFWLIAAFDGAGGPVTLKAFVYSSASADFSQAALLSGASPEKLAPRNRSRV